MIARVAVTLTSFLGIFGWSVLAQQDCILPSESNEDIFEVKPMQTFATNLKLIYPGDSSKIAAIINEDGKDLYGAIQNGLAGERRYFFRQCGSTIEPPQDTVPNFNVEVPVQHVVVSSTTQIGHLMVHNRIDTVAVYLGKVEWVTDQCFAERTVNATAVRFDPEDPKILVYKNQKAFADALEDPEDINRERLDELMESKRTLAFGPLGEGWSGDKRFVNNATQDGLIPSIPMYASKEQSGKAIFEWNEVYGFFYNEEKEARRNTLIKEKRWDCIANKVEKKWNDAVFDDKKPKVCWAYYLADNYGYDSPGFVWANSCKNGTLEDDFYCKLADSCHAELITGSGSEWYENIMDFDATSQKFEECDTIIYSSYYRNLVEVIEGENPERTQNRTTAKAVLQRTTAWKNGKVFDVTKSGSNNWHENRVVHYDRTLEDMCIVTDRHSKNKPSKRYFFRQLGPRPEKEGKDDECIRITVTESATGRRLETNCNTVATQQKCHLRQFRKCRGKTAACQLQKQCVNRSFRLEYNEEGVTKSKRIRCNRTRRNRKGLFSKQKFTCSNNLIARNCAKRCGECCPQLG